MYRLILMLLLCALLVFTCTMSSSNYAQNFYTMHAAGGLMCNYAIGDDYIYRAITDDSACNYFGPDGYQLYRRPQNSFVEETCISSCLDLTWPILAYTEKGLYIVQSIASWEGNNHFPTKYTDGYHYIVYFIKHDSDIFEIMHIALPDNELNDCIYYQGSLYFITNHSVYKYSSEFPIVQNGIIYTTDSILSHAYFFYRTYVYDKHFYICIEDSTFDINEENRESAYDNIHQNSSDYSFDDLNSRPYSKIIKLNIENGVYTEVSTYFESNSFYEDYECVYDYIVLENKLYMWNDIIKKMLSVDLSDGTQSIISDKLYLFKQITKEGVLAVETVIVTEDNRSEYLYSDNIYQNMMFFLFDNPDHPSFNPNSMNAIILSYDAVIVNDKQYMSVLESENHEDWILINGSLYWYIDDIGKTHQSYHE